MTLNIADLKFNKTLKQLAQNLDGSNESKKDGKLDAAEFDLFKTLAKNVVSDKAYNKAISLFKPEETKENPEGNVDKVETTASTEETPKADDAEQGNTLSAAKREKYSKDIVHLVQTAVKNDQVITLDTLVETIEKSYSRESAYGPVIDDIEKMVAVVKGMNIDSKDDVEKIRTELRKADGFKTGLPYYDLVYTIKEIAEKEQVAKERDILIGHYNEVMLDEANKDKSVDELIELACAKLGDKAKTSYYNTAAKKELKKYAVSQEAQDLRIQIVGNTSVTDAKNYTKKLNAEYKGDKLGQQAVKENKDTIDVRTAWNNYNNAATGKDGSINITKVTEEELANLRNKNKELFAILDKKFLHEHKNEDGTYDFTAIYNAIGKRMGADAIVMKDADINYSEIHNTEKDITVEEILGKNHDLTEEQMADLIEFCGGTVDLKDKSWKTAGRKALEHALPGLLGGLTGIQANVIRVRVDNGAFTQKDLELLKGVKGVTEQTVNGTKVLVINANLGSIIGGLTLGALEGLLSVLLFGEDKNEQSCISIQDFTNNRDEYKDLSKYTEYLIEKHGETKGKIFAEIAGKFADENGQINTGDYLSYLNEMAGLGSKLSCREVLNRDMVPGTTTPEAPVFNDDIEIEDEDLNSATVIQESKLETKKLYHVHQTQRKDTWEGIVKQYYPELVAQFGIWGKDGAIKQLQRAMSTKDGVYDANAFRTLIGQSDLKKELNIPTQITVNGVTYDIQYNERVQGTFVGGGNGKANFGGYANFRIGFINGEYHATCDQTGKTAVGKTKEEALANLKAETGFDYSLVIDFS